MISRPHPVLVLTLAAGLLAGCHTAPQVYTPLDATRYTIESTDKFVLLDQASQLPITCTGLQEQILPDGRFRVVANVRNQSDRPVTVQVNCVFKDEQGVSAGDETPFRNLVLGGGTTKAVTFTSMNNLARRYTVQVRQPR